MTHYQLFLIKFLTEFGKSKALIIDYELSGLHPY